jgi:hypothetical protein
LLIPRLSDPDQLMSTDRHPDLREIPVIENGGTGRDELTEKSGEEFIDDLAATPEQTVSMAALRYPAPVGRVVGQYVAFHHGDVLVEIGQYPRGEQPAHTSAENNRMLTELRHSHSWPPF